MTEQGMTQATKREQELRRQLEEALDRIARLEKQPPQVVVEAPYRTPYERFIAEGNTHRDWLKRQRRVAQMQNHY